MTDPFHAPVKRTSQVAKIVEASTKPPSVCKTCGWRFAFDNAADRERLDGTRTVTRKEPRTEICVRNRDGDVESFCTDCYEKALWKQGRHTKIGLPSAPLYRAALEKTDVPGSSREDVGRMLAHFAKNFGRTS